MMPAPLLRVRTVTVFVTLTKDPGLKEESKWKERVKEASDLLERVVKQVERETKLEVQTKRLATNNFFDYLEHEEDKGEEYYLKAAKELEVFATTNGFDFVSIGSVGPGVESRAAMIKQVKLVPMLLSQTDKVFVNVQLPSQDCDLASDCLKDLSPESCFRFTVCSCCPGGIPFFPAAYSDGNSALGFAFGMENSGLLYDTVEKATRLDPGKGVQVHQLSDVIKEGFQQALEPLDRLGKDIEKRSGGGGISFLGTDASIAPGLDHKSIPSTFELLGCKPFGSPGTQAICSSITRGLKSLEIKLCGYSGLMLPVCEDSGLADAYSKGYVNVSNFLQYSAVCGVGLDTFPVADDTPKSVIKGVLQDVCTLAERWNKPLSCRLLKCPGKKAGDKTEFKSPYLVEVCLQPLVPN